jgi:hypothetical protein
MYPTIDDIAGLFLESSSIPFSPRATPPDSVRDRDWNKLIESVRFDPTNPQRSPSISIDLAKARDDVATLIRERAKKQLNTAKTPQEIDAAQQQLLKAYEAEANAQEALIAAKKSGTVDIRADVFFSFATPEAVTVEFYTEDNSGITMLSKKVVPVPAGSTKVSFAFRASRKGILPITVRVRPNSSRPAAGKAPDVLGTSTVQINIQ